MEPNSSPSHAVEKDLGSGTPHSFLNRNFILLWQGQFVSNIGNQAFLIGMMFWTMQATGSGSLMGVLMMLSMLPGVILGPLGGTFADRYPKKRIIVLSDLLSGLSMTGLAAAFFFFPEAIDLLITLLFVVAVTNGILQAFFGPAILSAIPELVPKVRIPAANSMNQFSFQISRVLGQSTGGVLFGFLGATLLFLIDGLTFLFSSLSESFIRIPATVREKSGSTRQAIREVNQQMRQGLAYVWRWKGMRNFLIMVGVVHFFAMPFIVLMPFWVELYLGKGSVWYGFLMAGFSGGSVLGYIAAGALKFRPDRRSSILLGSLCMTGLLFGLLGLATNPFAALATIFLAGSFLGIFSINVTTILQTSSPSRTRGRVMGLFMTISNAASPLGMLAGGIAGDLTGKNIPLICAVCSLSIVAAVFLIGARRSVLDFLSPEPNRHPDPPKV